MKTTLSDISNSFSHPEQTASLDQCRRPRTVDCEQMNSHHVTDEIVTTGQSAESQYFSIDINIQTQKKPLHLWGQPSGVVSLYDRCNEYVDNHSQALLMADEEDEGFLYAMGDEYIHKSRYELLPRHQTCHLEGCNCLAGNPVEKFSNNTVVSNRMGFPEIINPQAISQSLRLGQKPAVILNRKMPQSGWNGCCALLGVSVPQNKPHKVPHRRRNRVHSGKLAKKKQSVLNLTIEIPSQMHEVFHSDADSVVYTGDTEALSIAVQTSTDDISTVDYNSTGGPCCYDDRYLTRCGFTQTSGFKDGAWRVRVLSDKTDQASAVNRVEVIITVDNSEDIAPSFMIS